MRKELIDLKKRTLGLLILVAVSCSLVFTACSSSPAEETSEVANPIKEYASVEELSQALGFEMTIPPALNPGQTVAYSSIDDKTGQAVISSDGWTLTLRKATDGEDISGVYGAVESKTAEIGGIPVKYSIYEALMVATWASGSYTYSIVGEGMDEASFDDAVQQIVAAAG